MQFGLFVVAFLANDPTDRLLVCRSEDAVTWSTENQVGAESSKAGPSLSFAEPTL